jgi:hypothetical protein
MELVRARAAHQAVVSRSADQRVVAAQPVQLVATHSAEEHVRLRGTTDDVILAVPTIVIASAEVENSSATPVTTVLTADVFGPTYFMAPRPLAIARSHPPSIELERPTG